MELTGIDIGIFVAYIVVVLGVGAYASRKGRRHKRDYFLAGDKLPCGWSRKHRGGQHIESPFHRRHGHGVRPRVRRMTIEWGAILIGLNALLWIFLPFYLRNGFYTMPEFLDRRFGTAARTTFAGLILIIYVFIEISAVLYLGAIALNSLLGIPLLASIMRWLC